MITAFSAVHHQALRCLSSSSRKAGLRFGVGFSPFEIWTDWGPTAKKALKHKLTDLDMIGLDRLAILFDDMKGDVSDLASQQVEIVAFIAEQLPKTELIFCPTYYSEDPILDQVFGPRPDAYLEDIGRLMPDSVAIYWTGPKVLSSTISTEAGLRISETLRRKPVLWSNAIANDGKTSSKHIQLHIPALPALLANITLGEIHLNPMNQIWLSLRALQAELGEYRTDAETCAMRDLCGGGLEAINQDKLKVWLEHPAAQTTEGRELTDWALGGYTFDPECLTD